MRRSIARVLFVAVCLLAVGVVRADEEKKAEHGSSSGHVMLTPEQVKWMPAPPALPPGAQLAILEGDPTKPGESYTIRAKLPDGYKVPPHWHPVDEKVTVIQGVFGAGKGEKFDPANGHEVPAGSFVKMPKGMRHFAWAKGETIIQIHGIGPFQINYVNPADDPRTKKEER